MNNEITPINKPFHIRTGKYARAFYKPSNLLQRIILFIRGWRPFGLNNTWHKPSYNQRNLERNEEWQIPYL